MDRSDVLEVVGFLLVVAGVWLVYQPAAVILAGVGVIVLGLALDASSREGSGS